jgi:hypothetical protein
MMIGIVTYLLQIVVLAGNPEALLRIGYPLGRGFAGSQEIILELVHSSIGKHQGRVILQDHGGGRDNLVFLLLEKVQKCLSDLL